MNLSERTNTVILHYGCADFNKPVHTIFWIGAIYYDNQVRFDLKIFSNKINIAPPCSRVLNYYPTLKR